MKRVLMLAGVALLLAGARAYANMEYWYIIGQDGCSEYVFQHNTQYNWWTVTYRCCGKTEWCTDAQGVIDPCGSGVAFPAAGTGTPVVYDSAGNEIVSVLPGHGGHVGSESGYCRSFIPDGSSTLVIPPWGLQ
ncbi:MAG: hypothetical protein JST22_20085 [Bacteroidetes bacterium]|nr:hypothetical protein [Bacteroidota bacterium]